MNAAAQNAWLRVQQHGVGTQADVMRRERRLRLTCNASSKTAGGERRRWREGRRSTKSMRALGACMRRSRVTRNVQFRYCCCTPQLLPLSAFLYKMTRCRGRLGGSPPRSLPPRAAAAARPPAPSALQNKKMIRETPTDAAASHCATFGPVPNSPSHQAHQGAAARQMPP